MILVAGGTGTLGRQVVRRLTSTGTEVRVLTRVAARAQPLVGTGAEVMVGDVGDMATVRAAVAGVSAVVSAVQGFAGVDPVGARAVDLDGNARLVQAAQAAGVRRFVLVSAMGASTDSAMELRRIKRAAELMLEQSRLDWTVIRRTVYLETWIEILRGMAARRQVVLLGRGRNRINFVGADDVAALLSRVVADNGTIEQTYEIGGPEDLTLERVAREVLDALDVEAPIRHVPLPIVRSIAVATRRIKPAVANIAEFGIVMDTTDMSLAEDTARARYPHLPATTLQDLLTLRVGPGQVDPATPRHRR